MRFVHTADNHLDMPLNSLPQGKSTVRKAERRSSFSKIIDYTTKNANMLIISGDLFHSPTPSASAINFCIKEFEKLGNIPVFIALGNHDYGISNFNFPGNVHIFPNNFERIIFKDVAVTGASFTSETAFLSQSIPSPDPHYKNILVLHGDLSQASEYNPLDKAKLLSYGYDYVALGHVHTHFRESNIVYPGCHDGGGFDESGEKGFIFADISCGLKLDFIPSSSRVYTILDFDVSPFDSSMALSDALMAKIADGIYRINLTGTLKEGFMPNIDYITSYLSEKAFYVSIKDNTRIDTDISQSSIYRFFSDYLNKNYDGEVASLAYKYGVWALKGVKEDL
ncbi:MAG: DNA repair exonuclease [Clostridia bacterium]|nr:DNA repair exonuclease [Clostridia bacterium]